MFIWNVDGSYTTDTDITGFEVIGAGALVNADSISATGFTRLKHGAIAGAVTYTNVAANSTLTLTANPTANSVITLASSAGTSDKFNLVLTKSGAVGLLAAGTVTVNNVETVAITTDDSDSTLVSPTDTLTLSADSVKTITVVGDAGLALTYTGTTATTVDASGITAGAFTYDSGALAAAATIKGSATGTNTIDFSDGLGIVTYTGGTGGDTINFGTANALNNIVNLGNGTNAFNGNTNAQGADSVTGGTGVDTILTGPGNDTIIGGGGADQITGGTGADKITVSGNTSDIFQFLGSSGANTSNTIQTTELTSGFDIVYGATAGFQINLDVQMGTAGGGYDATDVTVAGTNLAGVLDQIVFARGTYDAGTTIFTYAANGADTVVTYDSSTAGDGSTFESIILVGYVSASTTEAALGVITLA